MQNAKILCTLNGGSHLYGLNTANSDIDERGLFLNTTADYILGLRRFDEERKQNNTVQKDLVLKELSAWVRLLYQGNTEAYELLFAPKNKFNKLEPEFERFRNHANDFIDSKRFFSCIRGYGQSEYRLAIGERRGTIGAKRADAVDKYGFSPKNATQLLRLMWTAIFFFEKGDYIVEAKDFGVDIFKYLYEIKTKPESYSADLLTQDYQELEKRLVSSYENRKWTFHFNEKQANNAMLNIYIPYLNIEANIN